MTVNTETKEENSILIFWFCLIWAFFSPPPSFPSLSLVSWCIEERKMRTEQNLGTGKKKAFQRKFQRKIKRTRTKMFGIFFFAVFFFSFLVVPSVELTKKRKKFVVFIITSFFFFFVSTSEYHLPFKMYNNQQQK